MTSANWLCFARRPTDPCRACSRRRPCRPDWLCSTQPGLRHRVEPGLPHRLSGRTNWLCSTQATAARPQGKQREKSRTTGPPPPRRAGLLPRLGFVSPFWRTSRAETPGRSVPNTFPASFFLRLGMGYNPFSPHDLRRISERHPNRQPFPICSVAFVAT